MSTKVGDSTTANGRVADPGSSNGSGRNGHVPGVRHGAAAARSKPSLYHRVGRPLLGLLAAIVIAVAAVVLVRAGNGDFSPSYIVNASFASASAGLHPGSQVEERGVQIGSIRSIQLVHGRALISMSIGSSYKLPQNATATIEPQNLFGADEISISVPSQSASTALLANGGQITHTNQLDELGQLFATADPLLSQVDTADLARVVDELAAAYGGQGTRIANSLTAGTKLATLFSQTMSQQLTALDAFTRFQLAIQNEGPVFNQLGYDGNQTLPLFNAAESAYAKLLSDLGAFGNHLSVLLQYYRPQIDTILDSGGNVMRVMLSQQQNVVQVLQGLAMYAYKFAHGTSPATLPDGTKLAYFKTFILWNDVNAVICGLLAPPVPGLSYLEPLQHAVLGGGSPLNCSSQIAAFDRAQGSRLSKSGGSGASKGSGSSGPLSGLPGGVGSAAQGLANGVYGVLGTPQSGPASTGIGSYIDSLLGGLP